MKLSIVGLAFAASALVTPAPANADNIYVSGQITIGDAHRGKKNRHNNRTVVVANPTYQTAPAYRTTSTYQTAPGYRTVTHGQRSGVQPYPVTSRSNYGQNTYGYAPIKQERRRAVKSCKRAISSQYRHGNTTVYINDVNRIEKYGPDKFRIFTTVSRDFGRLKRRSTVEELVCVASGAGEVLRIKAPNYGRYNTVNTARPSSYNHSVGRNRH